MIVTPQFMFLHLHKSGGTFVNECLLKFVKGSRQVGYHLPRSLAPPEYAHLPALGLVRNPWSYYVSWYSFQLGRPQPNFLFRILSDDGALDFEPTVRNMLNLGAGSIRLELLLRALPSQYSNQGLNLPNFALAPIRDTRLGFYTYLYRYLYQQSGAEPAIISRMETMRDELLPMLESVGHKPNAELRAFVATELPRNTSQHGDYAQYYSASLRDLVARRDEEIISRHGYRFGD
jgi:hypothetical protein